MFESGCIKVALGNVLMDVTHVPGSSFRQDLVALSNAKDVTARHAWWLSEIGFRATVTPDLEQLMYMQPMGPWESADVPERYTEAQEKAPRGDGLEPPHQPLRRPSKANAAAVVRSTHALLHRRFATRWLQKQEPGTEEQGLEVAANGLDHDMVDEQEEDDVQVQEEDELVHEGRQGGGSDSE